MLVKFFVLALSLATLVHCDNRIRFVLYKYGNIHYTERFTVSNFHQILHSPEFVMTQETVMLHYGEDQNLATPQVWDIVNSYVANQPHLNFIMVDYDNMNVIRTGNANDLAAGITTAIISIFDRGYSSARMSMIGFGLGAHIMARASRQVPQQSARRHIVGRLTGLNPVDLGPINGLTIGRLTFSDAQFVETIHTEGNSIGDSESMGHVGFFVNGGMSQPFCTQTMPGARADCSHIFALTVWAETARSHEPRFGALSCDTWAEFSGGVCNNNGIAHVGRSNEMSRRGPYMLRTNLVAPYSRDTPFP